MKGLKLTIEAPAKCRAELENIADTARNVYGKIGISHIRIEAV